VRAYREKREIAPLILDLGTRGRRVFNFTPQPIYPQKRIPVPTE